MQAYLLPKSGVCTPASRVSRLHRLHRSADFTGLHGLVERALPAGISLPLRPYQERWVVPGPRGRGRSPHVERTQVSSLAVLLQRRGTRVSCNGAARRLSQRRVTAFGKLGHHTVQAVAPVRQWASEVLLEAAVVQQRPCRPYGWRGKLGAADR